MVSNKDRAILAESLRKARFSEGLYNFNWEQHFAYGILPKDGIPFKNVVTQEQFELLLELKTEIFNLYSLYANRILSRQNLGNVGQHHVAQVNMVYERMRDIDSITDPIRDGDATSDQMNDFFSTLRDQKDDRMALLISKPSRGVVKVIVMIHNFTVTPLGQMKSQSGNETQSRFSPAYLTHGGSDNNGALLAMRPSQGTDPVYFTTARRNYIWEQKGLYKRSGFGSVDLIKSQALGHFAWTDAKGMQHFARTILTGLGTENTKGNVFLSWTDLFLIAMNAAHEVPPRGTLGLTFADVRRHVDQIHSDIYESI